MKNKGIRLLLIGGIFVAVFVLWTVLVVTVDVKPVGVNSTDVGFSSLNTAFHTWTGVNMTLYTVTDWLGLVPIAVCMLFGSVGLIQLVKRKNPLKVDNDLLISGVYYVIVILAYLIFEEIPVNYRPVLINGIQEVSYPSSTTLLVLSVMPTLTVLAKQRIRSACAGKIIGVLTFIFTLFMVVGRLISGVHWITDIIGSVLLCVGLFCIYRASVLLLNKS